MRLGCRPDTEAPVVGSTVNRIVTKALGGAFVPSRIRQAIKDGANVVNSFASCEGDSLLVETWCFNAKRSTAADVAKRTLTKPRVFLPGSTTSATHVDIEKLNGQCLYICLHVSIHT